MKVLAIIMSGGIGSRMNSEKPKQLLNIGADNILERSIEKFNELSEINSIYVVSHIDLIEYTKKLVMNRGFSKVSKILVGGNTRQLSSKIGVLASDNDFSIILIHDSARPFVNSKTIKSVVSALENSNAVIPVIDSSDTLVKINKKNQIYNYLDRNSIKRVQTPQGFKRDIIVKAHLKAEKEDIDSFSDDSSMIIHYGLASVTFVEGDPANIKITYEKDLNGFKENK